MSSTEQLVTNHYGNTLNNALTVSANNQGEGGAYHDYLIAGPDFDIPLPFQRGNPDVEINGISNEVLLAVLIHRLEGFQLGPYYCTENQKALEKLISALWWLQSRHCRIQQQRGDNASSSSGTTPSPQGF